MNQRLPYRHPGFKMAGCYVLQILFQDGHSGESQPKKAPGRHTNRSDHGHRIRHDVDPPLHPQYAAPERLFPNHAGGGQIVLKPECPGFRMHADRLRSAFRPFGSTPDALAQTISQLIVMRIGQGLFSAAEAVLVYAIIHDYFEDADMVRALAIYGMAVALAPATAPIIGGYIHVWLGWRFNFILIALIGCLTTLMIWRVLPETSTPQGSDIQLGRIVRDYGNLLGNKHFMNYAVMTGAGSGFIMAMVTSGPFILISYLGVPVQNYGLFMVGPVSTYIISNLITRQLVGRFDMVTILKTGIGIAAIGALSLALMVFSDNVSLAGLVSIFSLTTFGLGPVWAIAPMKALHTTDRPTGIASAMINTVPMIMGALAALSLSIFHDDTARPLAGTILGLLLIAVISYLAAARKQENF